MKGKPIKDKTGHIYGGFVVRSFVRIDAHSRSIWLCECPHCKRQIELGSWELTSETRTSCGCDKTHHGLSKHPLMRIWMDILVRCGVYKCKDEKTYARYGGRGITICDEWRDSFQAFYDWCMANGWKPGLQIDRKDNSNGYSPDNCHFVTAKENTRNRACTYRFNCGVALAAICEELGFPPTENGKVGKDYNRIRAHFLRGTDDKQFMERIKNRIESVRNDIETERRLLEQAKHLTALCDKLITKLHALATSFELNLSEFPTS